MIRHPYWLAAELFTAVLIALGGTVGLTRSLPKPPPLRFSLSALGERALSDGSWQGVDLLRHPGAAVDRFQLTVRTLRSAQLSVDVMGPDGPQRIFPPPGHDGVLRPGVSYALPSPHGFYGVTGKVRLRIRLSARPEASTPIVHLAKPLPEPRLRRLPLSDGARFSTLERAYSAPLGGQVMLRFQRGLRDLK